MPNQRNKVLRDSDRLQLIRMVNQYDMSVLLRVMSQALTQLAYRGTERNAREEATYMILDRAIQEVELGPENWG